MNTAINAGDVTQVAIIEQWQWYFGALKNPSAVGSASLPVHPGEYQLGYYRVRRKNSPWEPVGIYPDGDGRVVAYRGDREVEDIPELFTWACRNPVTHQAYMDALAGKGWPDDDAIVAKQVQPPAPGDNSGAADPTEELADQIESALKGKDAYAKITDDATAAKALSLRNRLNELSGQADKIRVKEKEPHLEAGKAVDARWQPLVKKAKAGADEVKASIAAWETEKLRQQREKERQQQEELRKQEEARRASEAAGEDPAAQPDPDAETITDTAPPSIKPTYGKAASVSVKVVVKDVTDWKALAIYMAEHPDLKPILRNLAQRALDAGRTNIPGITTDEEANIR